MTSVPWIEEDRLMMVSERHDESDPSGVRRVRFVLQAPEVEMTIPDLPEAIILPPQDTSDYPFPDFPDSPSPETDFPEEALCCDDPSVDIEEVVDIADDPPTPVIVPPVIEHHSPSDPPPEEPPGFGAPFFVSSTAGFDGLLIASCALVQVSDLGFGGGVDLTAIADCTVDLVVSYVDVSGRNDKFFFVYATGPSPSVSFTGPLIGAIVVPNGAGPAVTTGSDDDISNVNGGTADSLLAVGAGAGNLAIAMMVGVRSGIYSLVRDWDGMTVISGGASSCGYEEAGSATLTLSMTDTGSQTGAHTAIVFVEIEPRP